MAVGNIPDGLMDRHYWEIKRYLEQVLDDLRSKGAKRVTSRLNCSNTVHAIPVWVGTVEDRDIETQRRFDVGLVRFGRINRSKVYSEAIKDTLWNGVERDWSHELPEKTVDGYGPGQAYGPQARCMYQVFFALRVKQKDGRFRHLGTLTAGFEKKPNKDEVDEIKKIMKTWAGEKSEYVNYLGENFNLGGPTSLRGKIQSQARQ